MSSGEGQDEEVLLRELCEVPAAAAAAAGVDDDDDVVMVE
jgi:hypothetical protein